MSHISASMSASMSEARNRTREKEWRRSEEFSGESATSSVPGADFHDDPTRPRGPPLPKNRTACNSPTLCVVLWRFMLDRPKRILHRTRTLEPPSGRSSSRETIAQE